MVFIMKDDELVLKIIRKSKIPAHHTSDDALNRYYSKRFRNAQKSLFYPDKELTRKAIGVLAVAGWTLGNAVGTYWVVRPISHPFEILLILIGAVAGFIVGVVCATVLNFLSDAYIDSINDEMDRRLLNRK